MKPTYKRETAETLALQVLGWIVAQDEMMGDFMAHSGLAPQDLRQRAAEPEFLAAVLDFLLLSDDWVMAFCTDANLPFTAPQMARAYLPGGEATHWT